MSKVVNAKRLRQKLFALQDDVLPKATARSINRVAGTVRTRTVRALAKHMGLPQKPIRRRVVISKKATSLDLQAEIRISGKPLNLIEFNARQLKRGVSARPWGRRQRFREAFIARMPNGSVIVVKVSAAGKAGKMIQKGKWAGKRRHIEAMWGPGIANEAASDTLTAIREATIKERLPIEMKRELRYRVAQLLVR